MHYSKIEKPLKLTRMAFLSVSASCLKLSSSFIFCCKIKENIFLVRKIKLNAENICYATTNTEIRINIALLDTLERNNNVAIYDCHMTSHTIHKQSNKEHNVKWRVTYSPLEAIHDTVSIHLMLLYCPKIQLTPCAVSYIDNALQLER